MNPPLSATEYVQRAVAHLDQGALDEAVADADAALALDADLAEAHVVRAFALYRLAQVERSAQHVKTAAPQRYLGGGRS